MSCHYLKPNPVGPLRPSAMKNTWCISAKRLFAIVSVGTWFFVFFPHSGITADLTIHGSTTFNRTFMEPYKSKLEAATGHKLSVIPNKSGPGIVALLEGRAQMAMISAPLQDEIDDLKSTVPNHPYERLQAHRIFSVRVALAVHPSNAIRTATLNQVRDILLGDITHWKTLGGADAPVKLVMVGGGGGVTTMVEAVLLDGRPASNQNIIYVRTPVQLVQIVEQEPLALGFAQLALVKERKIPELATDKPIEQVLSLVTLGNPNPATASVIDAARRIAQDYIQ